MEENKRLLKNTLLITMGNFGAKMIAFLLLPLYTSILTTSDYGKYDLIIAISAFVLPIITFSIHEALFRYIIDYKNDKEKFNRVVTSSISLLLIGNFLLGITLFIIHFFVPYNFEIKYIFLYIFSNSVFLFASNLLRGMGDTKKFAYISCSKNILQIVLNVVSVVVLKAGIKGLLISFFISECLGAVWAALSVKLWRFISIKNYSMKQTKELLKYSSPLIPNAIGSQIINISDRLIVSKYLGTGQNGIYSVSYKFPNVVDTVYHFFYMAWSESASIVFSKGLEKAKEYYTKLYFILDNFIFSTILLIIAYMPILYRLLIKGNYSSGFNYISILMIAAYFGCIAKYYSGIFTALKRTKEMAVSTVIAAIVNIVINILFIKKIGLYAAAISTLIADFILYVVRKKEISDFIVIRENISRILLKIISIILIMTLFSYSSIIKIIISIIYSTILFIILNKKTILSFGKLLKKKWRS